jgi:hypothetical protein
MNYDNVSSLSWWITQLGPSGIGLFIVWRVLLWLKPHVDSLIPLLKDLIVGHVKLMGVMEQHLTAGTITMKKVSDVQDEHGNLIKKIHDKVHCDDSK